MLVAALSLATWVAAFAPGMAAAAAPTYDMAGVWTTGYLSGAMREPQNGTWDITQMDMSTGAFSGTAEIEGIAFTLSGTESGAEVHQELSEGGYVAHDTYTLSVLAGGRVGTENGAFESGGFWAELGGSAEQEAKAKLEQEAKAKKEAEQSAKRPTGTSVTCNYEFATSEDTCVASVGDAGSGTPVTPTGTVTFTTTTGGFTSGATCALAPTPGSPSVGSCTLVYFTTNSGLPTITASYGGDARHAGSVGHTQFLGLGNEGTYEAPAGPSGQYPNEVKVSTEVPIAGTTVEGVVDAPNGNPAPLPLSLPALTGLDAISAEDLKLTEKDTTKVDNTGAQNSKDLKELGESLEKLDARTAELMKGSGAAEAAEAKTLQQDTIKEIEAATKMLRKQNQAEAEVIQKVRKDLRGAGTSSRQAS